MKISSDLTSTLDQLQAVDDRRRYFTERQVAMIEQVTHRAGAHWRAGRMDHDALLEFYAKVREVGAVGFMKSWDAAGLPDIRQVRMQLLQRAAYAPNEPDGSWSGTYPLAGQSRPPTGQAVVYLLYLDTEPVYLGSTESMVRRLGDHRRTGKAFTSWRAWSCRDREHAYQREEQMLRSSLPHLNKRAGR